ncbi:hypothetical protein ASG25_00625 [Rhizobium sp. Leaf384]|uniref:molybdenum cofactor guanylyltransferase MobA n=1 Tax=unclassified Rhizobium TaxID=2613769 RepID=UPI000714B355|nr:MULTISPECIES: molybdenum cofactor guanylyltransferase MobA [unclassified Rhizobium]KQS74443.1 hypothetical protein ASG58_15820 [Rhizobium sp. Leaf383]KQS80181.1 hypothetical protein ASG25_00625 [Rhizobium sp. Leaf384]
MRPVHAEDLPRTVLGMVLAGGLSSRMGRDKAGVPLAGTSLAVLALDRLRPQVTALAFNGNLPLPLPSLSTGILTVPETSPGQFGPLSGVLAGLRLAQSMDAPLLATVPVDAPFFPSDLVFRLRTALEETRSMIAVARSRDELHPVFAVWSSALARDLTHFIATDAKRRVRTFIEQHPHVVVDFTSAGEAPGGIDPFSNMNSPEDLERIEHMLARDEAGHR